MHLLGTCLLISSPERSQMSVPSGPSKTARKHLCPFFTCLFLVMMLDSCIYCCCVFAHVMQVRWKSGTLCCIHPEGLPWNPRLSCYAAALRSVLFSWQVFHFYSCYSVELFFHNFGAGAMCVTDWWSYLFVVEVDFSPINNKTSHFSEWHCDQLDVNLGSCLDTCARIPMNLLAVQEEEHWWELCKDGQANCDS